MLFKIKMRNGGTENVVTVAMTAMTPTSTTQQLLQQTLLSTNEAYPSIVASIASHRITSDLIQYSQWTRRLKNYQKAFNNTLIPRLERSIFTTQKQRKQDGWITVSLDDAGDSFCFLLIVSDGM